MLRRALANGFFYILVFAVCMIAFFPVYWLVNTSLLSEAELFDYPPSFVPKSNMISAYFAYITGSKILIWLRNSFAVSTVAVVVSTFLAIFGAYSISRFKYRGRILFVFIVLLTQMLPRVLIVIPVYVIFLNLSLNNSLVGLTLMYTVITVPIGLWFLKGFFDAIPIELEQAAIIDGCSRLQVLFLITVPLAVPGLVATATWSFIIAWDEFVFARTFVSSERLWTVSVGISSHIGQYSASWAQIMSGAVLATVPVALLFLVFQRNLMSGLTAGSVKG